MAATATQCLWCSARRRELICHCHCALNSLQADVLLDLRSDWPSRAGQPNNSRMRTVEALATPASCSCKHQPGELLSDLGVTVEVTGE
jgi:hypothetical protein